MPPSKVAPMLYVDETIVVPVAAGHVQRLAVAIAPPVPVAPPVTVVPPRPGAALPALPVVPALPLVPAPPIPVPPPQPQRIQAPRPSSARGTTRSRMIVYQCLGYGTPAQAHDAACKVGLTRRDDRIL